MPKAKERDGVYQRKDRTGWSVSYVDASGRRVRRKVAAQTRQQAMTLLSNIRTQEEKARTLGIRPVSHITTKELFARYSRHQKSRLRASTFERLGGILVTLEGLLPPSLKAFTKQTIARYIEMRSEVVKAGTVTKEISSLKHCLRLAVEWGLTHENVALGARLPRISGGRTRYLTPNELRATLEASPAWMKAPIAFAACTGVRRGEMLALRWIDVDLQNRRIYLRETKNGSLRILPLSEAASLILDSLPGGGSTDLVFPEVNAARLSVYVRRIFRRLGIVDASFHTLRHTSASWLVQQGVDLYTVGQLLGHKTPRMTQRYAHLSPEYMANAVGKLDGIMGGVLRENRYAEESLVTTASPLFAANEENGSKSLN